MSWGSVDRQMKDNVDMRAGTGEVGSVWFDTTLKVGNKHKTTRLGIHTKGETFEMMFDMSTIIPPESGRVCLN